MKWTRRADTVDSRWAENRAEKGETGLSRGNTAVCTDTAAVAVAAAVGGPLKGSEAAEESTAVGVAVVGRCG